MKRKTQEEEIRDLLTGKLYQYYEADRSMGEKDGTETYRKIGKTLSVSKQDILNYVQKNDLPKGVVNTQVATADGSYCVKQADGRYAVYDQERGCPYGLETFATYEQARTHIVESILSMYFGEDR